MPKGGCSKTPQHEDFPLSNDMVEKQTGKKVTLGLPLPLLASSGSLRFRIRAKGSTHTLCSQSQIIILTVAGCVRPLLPGVSSSPVIGYAKSHSFTQEALLN